MIVITYRQVHTPEIINMESFSTEQQAEHYIRRLNTKGMEWQVEVLQ